MIERLIERLAPIPDLADLPDEARLSVGGDHSLNSAGGRLPPLREGPLAPAAVLVGIVDHGQNPTVLLTQRTQNLTNNPGQIAFPGGRFDPHDADLADCALREAEEEIGLYADYVRIVGALSPYVTVTGFVVAPIVGVVRPGFSLALNPHEVADAFEVPLSFLLDDTNHRQDGGRFNGVERRWWAVPYGRHYIWGATAGMIRDLHQRWIAA